ncbi:hypothetical protein C1J03_18990 [Sulfitobacter sp. SK012]|uniref:DUF1254 domain-containing protein n=1 Tax=Sulfitobacter sp. SK012 TaxID=1389005 RepID=UPI000E0C1B37|nr:DUF1254 domain-containing protein [Sulfitobacter sp. SK012]AXI47906.1 hypothetical protein C1J03_18990 [Sulfitobacter sp. SK012]
MNSTKLKLIRSACTLSALTILATPAFAQMSDVTRSMVERRACEAAIWGLPAISAYDIELSLQRDAGAEPGVIGYMSAPMDSRHGFLTANDVTPYVIGGLTTKDGPIVIEVPPAGDKAAFFGTIVNAWQVPLADVGTTGTDKGEGGKYLILPPGYDGDVPEGYITSQSNTWGVHFAFRPVAKNGGTHADQAAYAQKLQWYPLANANNPSPTEFVDLKENPVNTLPVYDMSYFADLNAVVQREPVLEQDKAMMGMLASLGIERGKPFNPDAEMQEAMLAGLDCAYDQMQARFVTDGGGFKSIWDDRQWGPFAIDPEQAKLGFPFVTETAVLTDERAGQYFYLTYLPKNLGGGTFYLGAVRDADNNMLNGKDTYKLNVPADTPAEDFWSVIVYSMESKGFVQGAESVGRATPNLPDMNTNADGSVDVYFAPSAPEGQDANWIPTGEDFFLLFRLYGPAEGWLESGWKLADVEKVN